MSSSESSARPSLAPPGLTLEDIRAAKAELRLYDFVRYGWSSFEKARFVDNWHIEAICEHLEAVSRGQLQRLIINIPPRHMKSTGVCVAWPAWTWLQDTEGVDLEECWLGPSVQFLFTSYAQNLSTRDSVKCRRLIRSRWYQHHWGDRFSLAGDQNAKIRFDTDSLGYRIATSLDGMTTGEGGDIVVVDDPHNVKQAESDAVRQGVLTTWDESLSSRLNDPVRGAFVVICQRVKQDDLTGHILANETGWAHLCLPARFEEDHPNRWYGTENVRFTEQSALAAGDPRTEDGELLWAARIPEDTLDRMEARMGSFAVAGQMQQRPTPREGGMFKRAWFDGKVIEPGEVGKLRMQVRHWDLAATKLKATDKKGARTAGVKLALAQDGRLIVLDCIAQGVEGKAVRTLIAGVATTDGPQVSISLPQDPGQAGKVQKGDYADLLQGYIFSIKGEIGDKQERAEPFASQCEAGNVYLLRGAWNDEWLNEMCLFPGGARKDIPDACSGAYTYIVTKKPKELDQGVGIGEVFEKDALRPGYDF